MIKNLAQKHGAEYFRSVKEEDIIIVKDKVFDGFNTVIYVIGMDVFSMTEFYRGEYIWSRETKCINDHMNWYGREQTDHFFGYSFENPYQVGTENYERWAEIYGTP